MIVTSLVEPQLEMTNDNYSSFLTNVYLYNLCSIFNIDIQTSSLDGWDASYSRIKMFLMNSLVTLTRSKLDNCVEIGSLLPNDPRIMP